MENILSINLETSTAPIVREVRGRDYIEYGTEDWRNLYPQFLIDLYYNSSTHAAIVNQTAEMIAGEDLVCEEEDAINLETYVKLKKFLRHVNYNESLHQVIKKVAFDFKLQGAYAIHVVWNRERTEIVELYHVPVERVRAGRPNELGQIDTYFISADWANTRTNKPYPVAAFNVNDRTSGSQLIYSGAYSPNMDVYHTPDYIAGCNWALVDQKVAEFHLNNIENGFAGSYFISFANGIPTQEERRQIEKSLVDKFVSSSNAGKFILTFSDDKTRTPEITPISVSDADKQYLALQELLVSNICAAHRITSKTLMGIDTNNGFSSNADELINAANFYQNTVVRGFQLNILNTLQTIFSVNNIDLPVEFVQLKPITVQFDSKTIREVMTIDEIRADLGLEPLGEEDTVEQDVKLAKVGSMITDGKELPLFDTIEEAEEEAKRIGCSGTHIHTQDGKEYYMPCENHEQITSLKKCNCKKTENDFTELESFIEEFGEEVPEDWEIVDEEKVEDEHEDFDFEAELNNIANGKTELASTGTARPNARSVQDGVNKSYNDYYKVRYMYTKDNALSQQGETREFCRLMTSARKVYRKEDLLALTNKPVNAGWGARGAATYSIWLYKGGGNCHHYFKRIVYKTSLRNAKSNIKSSQIISDVKAISEGFTLRRNSGLVAKAPKRMKNNGFLKPR
mgnify:FL=1|tara:strand:- start:2043 stop:4091 length:2049 start_codon:yes stop_codon:yes gene_type:complete